LSLFRKNSPKWLNYVSIGIIVGITAIVVFQASPARLYVFPEQDRTPPAVSITDPAYPPTLLSGNITLKGITNDSSGIEAISADAHTYPFNGTMPLKPANTPSLISEGNKSKWSVPFAFKKPGVYRIVVTVRDNANNLNYAETTVNVVPFKETSNVSDTNVSDTNVNPRIAFVRYTNTESAYSNNGFYDFYDKYGFPSPGKKITTDLNLLTVGTQPSTSEIIDTKKILNLTNTTALLPAGDAFSFWIPFIDHVRRAVPNGTVTIMRDEDIHDGHIFYPDNKTDAYDALLLFHNEYVTQQEYDNLRQFVRNGGTIVFIDPNVFYAEVLYDRSNHTITFVKGHDWEFDGKAARPSVSERWLNETKEWIGGNFLVSPININITFANNPFNYTHFEEQYVNNPKDKIIIDYGIKVPPIDKFTDPYFKAKKVATYSIEYGKGKVIMIGLYGQNLDKNEDFMKFFDKLITDQILANSTKQRR